MNSFPPLFDEVKAPAPASSRARRRALASFEANRRGTRPSVREIFPFLRDRVLASRPIIGDKPPRPGADGVKTPLEPIYGKPTFRNVFIDGQLL